MEVGGVLADRANAFLARNPHSEDTLRRVLTLKLATVRESEEPTRRRAARSEFTDEEWRLASELADHPNRLLVTATSEAGDTYAEVAHEAVFRRWDKLREWIAAEREFLAWRTGLEAARRAWKDTADSSKNDALLMGAALTQAQSWLAKRSEDLSVVDREFIAQSVQRESKARSRARRAQVAIHVLLVGIILGLDRKSHLGQANLGIDKLRFLLRMATEFKFLDQRRYEHAARSLDEIGRLIGGWSKAHDAASA
jgi:hypothetical protein